MLLNIITQPNPLLRQKSTALSELEISSVEIQKFIDDMIETMRKKDGIGLAAVQTASPIRLAVIDQKLAGGEEEVLVLINPIQLKKSLLKEIAEEGCLSVPGYVGLVKRPKTVTISFIDRHGKNKKLKAKNWLARVIQHEMDHLDGILFVDKAEKIFKLE